MSSFFLLKANCYRFAIAGGALAHAKLETRCVAMRCNERTGGAIIYRHLGNRTQSASIIRQLETHPTEARVPNVANVITPLESNQVHLVITAIIKERLHHRSPFCNKMLQRGEFSIILCFGQGRTLYDLISFYNDLL